MLGFFFCVDTGLRERSVLMIQSDKNFESFISLNESEGRCVYILMCRIVLVTYAALYNFFFLLTMKISIVL